jgi:hypothetical protein
MNAIYVGQSALRIRLLLNVDITGAQETLIKFSKPSGETGEWNAEVESDSEGIIYYDLLEPSDLDEAGDWVFWGSVQFEDGRIAPSRAIVVKVRIEGTPI